MYYYLRFCSEFDFSFGILKFNSSVQIHVTEMIVPTAWDQSYFILHHNVQKKQNTKKTFFPVIVNNVSSIQNGTQNVKLKL